MFIFLVDDLSIIENENVHEKWCNDLAAKFLCIFVLDRFSDFVSDQVSFFSLRYAYILIGT